MNRDKMTHREMRKEKIMSGKKEQTAWNIVAERDKLATKVAQLIAERDRLAAENKELKAKNDTEIDSTNRYTKLVLAIEALKWYAENASAAINHGKRAREALKERGRE